MGDFIRRWFGRHWWVVFSPTDCIGPMSYGKAKPWAIGQNPVSVRWSRVTMPRVR